MVHLIPMAPEGIGNLGNFIYVGTQTGQIYVTQDGGGGGTSNNWINISAGLRRIAPSSRSSRSDPRQPRGLRRHHHGRILHRQLDPLGEQSHSDLGQHLPANNIHNLAYSIFGQNYDPTTDPNSIKLNLAVSLSSIVADWRYAIPNRSATTPAKGYLPGPLRRQRFGRVPIARRRPDVDLFPDTTYGAVVEWGLSAPCRRDLLSLSLGNIDPDTGMPTLDGPYAPNRDQQTTAAAADPDTLMASTYGQGEFAINLAPLILGNAVTVTRATPGTGHQPCRVVTGPITISGSSEISGFGNATWITIEDVTNPADPFVIAGFNPADRCRRRDRATRPTAWAISPSRSTRPATT